jgi:hypothetical protein
MQSNPALQQIRPSKGDICWQRAVKVVKTTTHINLCFRLLYNQSMFNKTFYKFLFSFIAVVAGVLLFILVLGASSPA